MAQSSLFSSNNKNYMTYPDSTENIDGLAGTVRPNVTGRDYSLSSLNQKALFDNASQQPAYRKLPEVASTTYDNALFENASQQPTLPPAVDPTMWEKFKTGVSNYGKDADGKYNAQGSPLIRDLTAVGGLGLGVASFLEQRKTAGLQRDALRHDIATAKEHRANRQALGDSWNRAWGK